MICAARDNASMTSSLTTVAYIAAIIHLRFVAASTNRSAAGYTPPIPGEVRVMATVVVGALDWKCSIIEHRTTQPSFRGNHTTEQHSSHGNGSASPNILGM